uniref:Uncharacterized protein n=1 Tax=Arundo donax TaxID=35708 RepID=A0A0A9A946_ARUDO
MFSFFFKTTGALVVFMLACILFTLPKSAEVPDYFIFYSCFISPPHHCCPRKQSIGSIF